MVAKPEVGQDQSQLFRGFPVKIEIFEGPLDLLLHLVRRQEVEIAEVRVSEITVEYLRYLGALAEINTDLAGEFLVMAANLLWLKSRMLLPRQQTTSEEEEELLEEEFINSEEELRRRLEDYRAYKEAAGILAESREMRQRVFLRSLSDGDEMTSGFVPMADVSLFDMVSALQEMLERTKEPPRQVIRPPEITVGDCIEDVLMRLRSNDRRACNFADLVELPTTRVMVVLVFLATLELIRRRQIRVSRGTEARQIVISLADGLNAEVD